MATKSAIAIKLSKLPVFTKGNLSLEQYPTDSEIAAESLWTAFMNGDIEGKVIADLGAGTGILGIAALVLGAKFVYFVEKDNSVIELLQKNLSEYEKSRYIIVNSDISDFNPLNSSGSSKNINAKIDTIIMNPPFGTKTEHADRDFLVKAFLLSSKVYSFHKTTTSNFVEKISSDSGFIVVFRKDLEFPLKQTYSFHKSKIKRILVSLFCLARK